MSAIGARRLGMAAAAVGLGTAVLVVPSGAHAAPPIPTLRLINGVSHFELDRFTGDRRLYLSDPAYVAAVNGAFEIDAIRGNHTITLHQVIRSGNKTTVVRKITPAGPVRMTVGLPDFFTMTLTNSAGAVVATSLSPFCPAGGYDTQRVDPANSPMTTTYPQECGSKLTHAMIWGIDDGWASGLFSQIGVGPKAAPDGNYTLTVAITKSYARQLRIPPRDANVQESVALVTQTDGGCVDICPPVVDARTARRTSGVGVAFPRPIGSSATSLGAPGLPDLVALPAHDLGIRHVKHSGQDWLGFAATIWNAGPGTFDIEGFRQGYRHTMQARQYVATANGGANETTIGTFKFDNRVGHHHWHLEDVARYTLLDQQGNRVVRSHKQSFCLAPTDPINLVRPGAQWNPGAIGLSSACPSDQSLWLRETLPAGWGDTYVQEAGGQAFNITTVPNGSYLIRVTCNPHGNIHEITRSNNSSYLEIRLGGTPGARTITTVGRVPAPH